jgi:tetrahydromethanopterin S-methyltransferase subunit G
MEEKDNTQDKKIIVLETNYKSMSEKIDDLKKAVETGFGELKKEFKCIREENERKYVSQEKFEPIRMIVYGMVGLILITVFGYLLKVILI